MEELLQYISAESLNTMMNCILQNAVQLHKARLWDQPISVETESFLQYTTYVRGLSLLRYLRPIIESLYLDEVGDILWLKDIHDDEMITRAMTWSPSLASLQKRITTFQRRIIFHDSPTSDMKVRRKHILEDTQSQFQSLRNANLLQYRFFVCMFSFSESLGSFL